MYQLQIPVRLEKISNQKSPGREARTIRKHIGTVYFPEGTTANDVCVHVTKTRKEEQFGIWLLQKKVSCLYRGYGQDKGVEDDNYETVKDSKYVLEDGLNYVVVHFSGMDVGLLR